MRDLPNQPETGELQRLAAALVRSATGDASIPIADVLVAKLRADGSLATVVWPGPKLIFTPQEVASVRAKQERDQIPSGDQTNSPWDCPESHLPKSCASDIGDPESSARNQLPVAVSPCLRVKGV